MSWHAGGIFTPTSLALSSKVAGAHSFDPRSSRCVNCKALDQKIVLVYLGTFLFYNFSPLIQGTKSIIHMHLVSSRVFPGVSGFYLRLAESLGTYSTRLPDVAILRNLRLCWKDHLIRRDLQLSECTSSKLVRWVADSRFVVLDSGDHVNLTLRLLPRKTLARMQPSWKTKAYIDKRANRMDKGISLISPLIRC